MITVKNLLVASVAAWVFVAVGPAPALAHSVEDELNALLLQYYTAVTNADVDFIDNITSHNPEVTLLGTDPTEIFIGHDSVIGFWQGLFAFLGGGLTTVPGAGSPDVITRKDEAAWLVDTQSKWVFPGGDQPFRLTVVFRKEQGQWKLIQQHYSIGVPNAELPL
jgi:ketosteroid isomerase-like protein